MRDSVISFRYGNTVIYSKLQLVKVRATDFETGEERFLDGNLSHLFQRYRFCTVAVPVALSHSFTAITHTHAHPHTSTSDVYMHQTSSVPPPAPKFLIDFHYDRFVSVFICLRSYHHPLQRCRIYAESWCSNGMFMQIIEIFRMFADMPCVSLSGCRSRSA